MADSGREASRERRRQLVQGKTGLPAAAERTRNGANRANGGGNVAMSPAPVAAPAPVPSVEASVAAPQPASATQSFRPVGVQQGRAASMARREQLVRGKEALRANGQGGSSSSSVSMPSASSTAGRVSPEHGREASMMRRQQLVRGKSALQSNVSAAPAAMPAASASVVSSAPAGGDIKHGRAASMARRQQLVRGKAAVQGNYRPGNDSVNGAETPSQNVARSGSNGAPRTINYPPKVTETVTYGDRVVTGIRIGRGTNVTGDEPGHNKPVTGSQYIGRESGTTPRMGGVKVGASRTEAGLVVTGTQVRNTIKITGDEPNPNLKITGEADQGADADLVDRSAQQVYSSTQFDRNSSPHGHTVFGYNLGRSAKAIGSRERDRKNAVEVTEKGLSISGVAVGRSGRVTGDHAGSCRSVTGDQYLTPASQLPFCEPGAANAVTGDVEDIGMRERVSGINVEHHTRVTGSEAGHHLGLTGTPYLPQSSVRGDGIGQRVSGNVTLHADHVTGTARGAGRNISGTPYYREEREANVYENARECVEDIDQRFSVRSPQREAQLRVREAAAQAPAGKVTGTFAAGEGKITGNQEFMFRSRAQQDRKEGRITGEGRQEGAPITGAAWQQHNQVTGTEGHFATERNPSASAGEPHAFAGAGKFKGKGNHTPPTSHVTGMVGWSAKTAARVTLSGGAQG